jgi:hypothetical protein
MPRLAGSKPNYTFVLRNENTGRYVKDVTISLPSTSTIVKRTLAAPQLVGWAYRQTLDGIAGLLSELGAHPEFDTLDGAGYQDIYDILSDAAWADEWLAENSARPDDVRDARATQGTAEHATLERLAVLSLQHDGAELDLVAQLQESSNGFERAIGGWWDEQRPQVVASEVVLPCPQYGYCGSVDLIWYDSDMVKVTTDLKTRRAGLESYDSDEFQVDGYMVAYNLLHPESPSTRGSVLVARENGTWGEYPLRIPPGSFLQLKAVHDIVQGRGR